MNLTKLPPPVMVAALLGLTACTGTPTLGSASPGQAANSQTTGSTSDPSAPTSCKVSTDPSGVPCKICVDSSGAVAYDDCTAGASGTGGSGGTGGSTGTGGTTAGDVKCVPTTDPSTGAACKTCYAADGSYTSYCSAPSQGGCLDASGKNSCGAGGSTGTGGSGGSGTAIVKCAATTDPSTGAACKTCYAADGSVVSSDCSGGAGGSTGTGGAGGSGTTIAKCAATTDPSTGAACKTCYAADGSVVSSDCSGGAGGAGGSGMCSSSTDPNGVTCQTCYGSDGSISSSSCTPPTGGASCVGATNIETGQVCKVCSDTTSGKLLFVDCPTPACVSPSPSTTTTAPPTK